MTLSELLPSLHELSNEEKLEAIEFLNKELKESFFTEKEYTIFTPYDCEDAAIKLMELLEKHNAQRTV